MGGCPRSSQLGYHWIPAFSGMTTNMNRTAKPAKILVLVLLGVFTSLMVLYPVQGRAEIFVDHSPISFMWTHASGPVDHYNVYVSVNGAPFRLLKEVSGNRCQVDVVNGRSYVLRVEAEDAVGRVGPLSDRSEEIVVQISNTVPNCDDGRWCNGTETYDPALGCQPGVPPCQDDGLFCNGRESCNEIFNRCTVTNVPNCSDGNDCTSDYCNEAADRCENSCNATSSNDSCCEDFACSNDPICASDDHPLDLNEDGCIEMSELMDYIDFWYSGGVTMNRVLEAIDLWYSGEGC